MPYQPGVRPWPGEGKACVYLLQRRDRKRFKLGWSVLPMERARRLPEFRRGELDLDASRAVWLPSRPRAEQVERSMHKTLAPFATPVGHAGDGHQEWFEGVAYDTALRLLAQMPTDDHAGRPARVVPLTLPATPAGAVSIETGPQDTWWAVEDLLSRLAMHCAISVGRHDGLQVVLHGLRRMTEGAVGALRRAALDPDTYQCRRHGRWVAFVRTIDFQGDDLVLDFAPTKVIERWEEGTDLPWQMRSFLVRLERKARVPRSA